MNRPRKITPMLRQYLAIKEEYPDTILFYRLGDFYEMFFDDARRASKILGITLTTRNPKDPKEDQIPLCGVPWHAAEGYLAKLVRAGHRVAVCEQAEDPAEAKGLVKREVVRIVTPGLVTEEQLLDEQSNRYLAAVCKDSGLFGLSLVDLSTGEFLAAEREGPEDLLDELARMAPAELLLDELLTRELTAESLPPDTCITQKPAGFFQPDTARELLLEHFKTTSLAGFGCEQLTAGQTAAGGIIQYLQETQKTGLSHIERLSLLAGDGSLIIDDTSRRNLELTRTLLGSNREGSLLHCLDQTNTPMGARLLKKNLLFPLQDAAAINQRLDTVEDLCADTPARREIREQLDSIHDLERLNARIVLGRGNGRDLTALKHSLARLPILKELARRVPGLKEPAEELDPLEDIHLLLESAIREDSPVTLKDGGIIQPGFSAELDELVTILTEGRALILNLEQQERENSGIANLKIGFNKVFGYYFEVSKAQQGKVPDYFIRKQTLVNAERYITPALKEFENKVAGAQEKRLALEYQLFNKIRKQTAGESPRILAAAALVAQFDFFCCLAETARLNGYSRPEVNDSERIKIVEGRHPVIERSLPRGKFVPNDILLNQTDQEVLIITGPNMAGKSTVLRQTALIVLMAQMGSFVPAAQAEIGVVDRIFTRVGAMDDLRKAQSTFMVEMNETASILNNATERSLVVLDEIGRGTSTFDGLSIAWAVTEDLVNKNGRGVKTIFATHYHEITDLARTSERVKNFNIAVREWNNTIVFLHKLLPGGTNRSYGIQVAALAGVPERVIQRAQTILKNIEKGEFNRLGQPCLADSPEAAPPEPSQLELFHGSGHPLQERLAAINPDSLSPLEALELIYQLKELSSR